MAACETPRAVSIWRISGEDSVRADVDRDSGKAVMAPVAEWLGAALGRDCVVDGLRGGDKRWQSVLSDQEAPARLA
jgi:hypothetical protein